MIGPESRLRHRERVLTQRAGDSLVLLDVDGGEYFALDEVSGRVWDLCDGLRDVAAIITAVSTEYDAPAETIRADIEEFLQEMVDASLLVVVQDS